MVFYNDKSSIITDSLGNIYNVECREGVITGFCFNCYSEEIEEKEIANNVLEEYDVAIRNDDCIHVIYQGYDRHLYLSVIVNGESQVVRITETPISNVFNLSLLLDGDEIHIFYNILVNEEERNYRIYHHHYSNNHWNTTVVEDTRVLNILNPINLIYERGKLFIVFYDLVETEEIFIKSYDTVEQIWTDKIRLTYDPRTKLYLDTLLENNTLHLTYSRYVEGNLAIVYVKFNVEGNNFNRVKESILSNVENGSYPTLIKYLDKLWVIWVEYESILSRYSIDNGENWSSIYKWKESKSVDFVRYKYSEYYTKEVNKKLNYSFGIVHPDLTFLGFGPLENIDEVPLKKKNIKSLRIPRI